MTNGLLLRVPGVGQERISFTSTSSGWVMAKVAARANDKGCPFRGEKPGSCFTQTAARSRDDDDFSFDVITHYLIAACDIERQRIYSDFSLDGHTN